MKNIVFFGLGKLPARRHVTLGRARSILLLNILVVLVFLPTGGRRRTRDIRIESSGLVIRKFGVFHSCVRTLGF